jgi:FtsP/CotA-like multicopper oxidase with cupredoxin domain
MERFIWSFDGVIFSEAEPVHFPLNERLRIVLRNDTMMNHPIHLHGIFGDLENPQGEVIARERKGRTEHGLAGTAYSPTIGWVGSRNRRSRSCAAGSAGWTRTLPRRDTPGARWG